MKILYDMREIFDVCYERLFGGKLELISSPLQMCSAFVTRMLANYLHPF